MDGKILATFIVWIHLQVSHLAKFLEQWSWYSLWVCPSLSLCLDPYTFLYLWLPSCIVEASSGTGLGPSDVSTNIAAGVISSAHTLLVLLCFSARTVYICRATGFYNHPRRQLQWSMRSCFFKDFCSAAKFRVHWLSAKHSWLVAASPCLIQMHDILLAYGKSSSDQNLNIEINIDYMGILQWTIAVDQSQIYFYRP